MQQLVMPKLLDIILAPAPRSAKMSMTNVGRRLWCNMSSLLNNKDPLGNDVVYEEE